MHLKRQNSWPPDVSALDALNYYTWQKHLAEKSRFKYKVYKTSNKYYEITPSHFSLTLPLKRLLTIV